jgi:hypothetical protein
MGQNMVLHWNCGYCDTDNTLTRAPTPITGGRAFPIDEMGIAIVALQIAYIIITVIIIAKERSGREQMIRAKRV